MKQQQFLYMYIFGAVCPAQKTCGAIVAPYVSHKILEEHLKEISAHVPGGRHALLIMDRAGWHCAKDLKIPKNISLLHLPPYSPELNPQEQIWQYLKDKFLSNRVFKNTEEIVEACCDAWNKLANNPMKIESIAYRNWTNI